MQYGDLKIVLAEKLGLCWGAERAVEMALAAKERFPEKRAHITNEILHNPGVNDKLKNAGIEFVPQSEGKTGEKDWSDVSEGDLVILPAFGAKLEEMQRLDQAGVTIVDTTCPWVSKVWGVVDKHKTKDMTSVIHGKFTHEEAIATASFADKFLLVKNEAEAQFVCDYIAGKITDRALFFEKFDERAYSKGFDPDKDLKKIGLANQTTMYKSETRAIGRMLERAVLDAFGPEELKERYLEFDTICDATQERQDAIHDLISEDAVTATPLDLVLVVGGFDSSNTAHLLEIPMEKGMIAYHIDSADCIGPDNSIRHRLMDGSMEVTKPFLPSGALTMGVTSGASTPDAYLVETIETAAMLHKLLTVDAGAEPAARPTRRAWSGPMYPNSM